MSTTSDPRAGAPIARAAFCAECGTPAAGGNFCVRCGEELPARAATGRVVDLTETRELPRPEVTAPAADPVPALVSVPEQRVEAPEPMDDEEVPSQGRLRWAALSRAGRAGTVAVAVLVLTALVAGTLVALSYLGDRDVRSALAATQEPYRRVLADLGAADGVAAVLPVAARAGSLAPVLDGHATSLARGDDAYGRAAAAQVRAESAVLAAISTLTDLEREPLATWGTAHPALLDALEAESSGRAALARHDGDAVRGLPDGTAVLAALAAAVAPELSDDAATRARALVAQLEGVTTTAGLRDLAGPATAQRSGVEAAVVTLSDGPDRATLTGMSTALAALGALGDVSGENPGPWDASRAGLSSGMTQLAEGSGDTALAASLTGALATVDRVVAGAAGAITDWRAQVKAATEARDADALALKEYADAFRSSMARYGQLRTDLQTFTARVEDPTTSVSPYDGFTYMTSAAEDREALRDGLNWMTVPAEVRGAHTEVVGVVDRAIRAVQSGYDGLEQWWYCEECSYRETPGWQTFQDESTAITKAFSSSVEGWESAVAAATASITARELPAKPDV